MKEILEGLQKKFFLIGVAGLVVSAFGFFMARADFMQAYLGSYILWTGVSLGCFALLMVHQLSGGAWGRAVRPFLISGTSLIPFCAPLFIPILLSVKMIYPWAGAREVPEAIMAEKAFYLNTPGFTLRFIIYFVIWFVLSRAVIHLSKPGSSEASIRQVKFVSGIGLLTYVVTMTLASVDWAMSLSPEWFSTVYGLHFIVGQGLSALTLAAIFGNFLMEKKVFPGINAGNFHDLGNLTLAFVMLWAYLTLSQFLITWSGNLPEEITWYLERLQGGWQTFGTSLVIAHFVLPFLLLLARKNKRNGAMLAKIGIWIFVMRYLDVIWYLGPAFHPGKLNIHWLDVSLWVGMGGIWLGLFSFFLKNEKFPEPEPAGHGHSHGV